MIADLQHLVHPDLFTTREREARTQASRDVARVARRIVTISDFSRRSIIELLGADPGRVVTSYLGVDPIFDRVPSPAERDAVLKRYDLIGRNYLFLPAQLLPHKNHKTVVNALRHLASTLGEPPLLVCSGSTATAQGAALMQEIATSDVGEFVRFLGHLPREDMPALYASAEALTFCSLHEGFGLPVIEAMSMGCPVIAADKTSLPEVAGDAALFVDPLDANAIAAAVLRLRANPALRQSLINAGKRQAARFSWERHCSEIVELLHGCVGRSPPSQSATRPNVNLRWALTSRSLGAQFRQSIYPIFRHRLLDLLRPS